jgi:hypothetical protein
MPSVSRNVNDLRREYPLLSSVNIQLHSSKSVKFYENIFSTSQAVPCILPDQSSILLGFFMDANSMYFWIFEVSVGMLRKSHY